ncbi:MAG TPA: serine O-acetyltransferase EpsC [Jatrophihabitans sp.]|nr:serine O-acetyltransferase EpsC [Jatrophihabitans sp.]
MFISDSDRPRWRRLVQRLRTDLEVARRKDPASATARLALLHPGVHAVVLHRAAHRLHRRGLVVTARLLAYLCRVLTGVDIHPGAVVGEGVFIDHGCGVVIGETAVLESEVMLYHNVTIGSVGWWNPKVVGDRRHPVICRGSVLCTGSLILGPVTVGADCVIGANAIVLADVPPNTRIAPGQLWQAERPSRLVAIPGPNASGRTE